MIPMVRGILPPMITPFLENGEVDFGAFLRNIERWNKDSLAGYLVLGSNSETAYLNEEEKLKLIELTVQTSVKGRVVLAGTGLESTQETIRLTNKAAKFGVHAALVLTPSFYSDKMNDNALISHFTLVADSSDIPILIYNVPKYTHQNISVEVLHHLSQHPNITGMKDSLGNVQQLEMFKKAVPDQFNLIVGTASALYPALELGITAGILALANCAPGQCAEIQRLYDKGDHQESKKLYEQMLAVNKAVTDTFGIAGLKYASTLMGFEGGLPRKPLLPLNAGETESVKRILEQAGLLNVSQFN